MRIATPKETYPGESRTALTPSGVKRLCGLGLLPVVESGLGEGAGFPDAAYADAGAEVAADRAALFAGADLVLRMHKPQAADLEMLQPGAFHASFLDPYNEKELLGEFCRHKINAISLEMIPRTTLAQKMDVLSSQASLAGYVAVIEAAQRFPRVFPMMITPAGTITPVRVFIIGVGVAGLQAIATAKRLGARVEAFDTRPVVAEQVRSLGARFAQIDLGETGQTEQGYAKELTAEQLELQRQGMKALIAASDVVITTAQLFGRPAPRIVTKDMLEAMHPGSVVIDLAASSGGNVEGSKPGKTVQVGNAEVLGLDIPAAQASVNASEMFSANLCALVAEIWDSEAGGRNLKMDNEILRGCLVTHDGAIVHPALQESGAG